jgi:hypothetical protein
MLFRANRIGVKPGRTDRVPPPGAVIVAPVKLTAPLRVVAADDVTAPVVPLMVVWPDEPTLTVPVKPDVPENVLLPVNGLFAAKPGG